MSGRKQGRSVGDVQLKGRLRNDTKQRRGERRNEGVNKRIRTTSMGRYGRRWFDTAHKIVLVHRTAMRAPDF